MKAFIISDASEIERAANVKILLQQLPDAYFIQAVYPSITKVPFLDRLISVSKLRTGKALLPAEIGCLLSHRKIWRQIVQMELKEEQHYIILESDSCIKNLSILNDLYSTSENSSLINLVEQQSLSKSYDLFFLGAWLGHVKLFRSTKQPINQQYTIGVPFIKTVYCTYGYSINRKAAAYLLANTKKIAYPVDQFKYYIQPDALRIGSIVPELISAGTMGSYINQMNINAWQQKWYMRLLDFKNSFICFFK